MAKEMINFRSPSFIVDKVDAIKKCLSLDKTVIYLFLIQYPISINQLYIFATTSVLDSNLSVYEELSYLAVSVSSYCEAKEIFDGESPLI